MNLRHATLLLAALAFAGCATPQPVVEFDDDEEDVVRPKKPRGALEFEGQPVAVPAQFDDCLPLDETEELFGTVTMLPFGKRGDGVVIDDGDVKWVVSYDADGVFADFEKEDVLARGRRCDKQRSSVKAYHFDVQSLRVVAR